MEHRALGDMVGWPKDSFYLEKSWMSEPKNRRTILQRSGISYKENDPSFRPSQLLPFHPPNPKDVQWQFEYQADRNINEIQDQIKAMSIWDDSDHDSIFPSSNVESRKEPDLPNTEAETVSEAISSIVTSKPTFKPSRRVIWPLYTTTPPPKVSPTVKPDPFYFYQTPIHLTEGTIIKKKKKRKRKLPRGRMRTKPGKGRRKRLPPMIASPSWQTTESGVRKMEPIQTPLRNIGARDGASVRGIPTLKQTAVIRRVESQPSLLGGLVHGILPFVSLGHALSGSIVRTLRSVEKEENASMDRMEAQVKWHMDNFASKLSSMEG